MSRLRWPDSTNSVSEKPGTIHFVWMPDEVRRELRSNGQVDGPPVAFAQVQEAPGCGVRENFPLGIPLKGEAHQLRQVPVLPQLIDELTDVVLRAASDERDLCLAHYHRSH